MCARLRFFEAFPNFSLIFCFINSRLTLSCTFHKVIMKNVALFKKSKLFEKRKNIVCEVAKSFYQQE